MNHIYTCAVCGTYTMLQKHCSKATQSVKPAKFSPDDKYADMTRKAKEDERRKQGLL